MNDYRWLKRLIVLRFGAIWRFAMELDVHPSQISAVLAGRRRLSREMEERWMELLGVRRETLGSGWDPLAPLSALVGGPDAQEEVEANKEQIGSEGEEC